MTSYERPTERPEGRFYGFHHIEFFVSNAKQAAEWWALRFGGRRLAYRGLETGSADTASHVVAQNQIRIVFTSSLVPKEAGITRYVGRHGDGAKDVAFLVDDARVIYKKAVDRGAVSVSPPQEYTDENGTMIMASLLTYGDCVHTLIQNVNYKGPFLPGFAAVSPDVDALANSLEDVGLQIIDHVVGNQPDGKMTEAAEWYTTCLDFHRFWSVDDEQVHSDYSALRSIVVTDFDEVVKMPLNEPAPGKRKSQIQEYVEYHGGPGVQHIALRTRDIVKAVRVLRSRGVEFLSVPPAYYEDLRKRLASSPLHISEDLETIERLNILVDFDDKGYLLQLFTMPVEDRPTLFYEIIQRHNNTGFGVGNFKALFEAIEREQWKREKHFAAKQGASKL